MDSETNSATTSQERAENNIHQPESLSLQASERASASSSNLILADAARHCHIKTPSRSSPFYWNWPPQVSAWEEKRAHTVQRRPKGPTRFWHGWKVIVFGSWLNVLLVIIPVSWILHCVMENSHTLDFIFCTLAMIPLVKMHDLVTQDLALRIGGSKTGLMNASLSNIVELVVAITALRQCELKVVQSSLIGAILSKLLLVLGMCFFAGGLRFSEQDFNASLYSSFPVIVPPADSTTQIHSSLLSISVGALLLPAAYHFALSRSNEETAQEQKQNILRMSRGVAIVLMFIYGAYLVFQLWSHTHFYEDSKMSSNRLSTTRKDRAARSKRSRTSDGQTNNSPYMNSPCAIASDVTLGCLDTDRTTLNSNQKFCSESAESSMADLVEGTYSVDGVMRYNLDQRMNAVVDASTITCHDDNARTPQATFREATESPFASPEGTGFQPQLSWTITLSLLAAVTIMVSFNAAWLVDSLDTIESSIDKEWVALIMLPTVSSIAECATAMNVSVKDQLTLSVSVAVSSTIQTALFVIPFMVTLAWIMNKPLALLFDPFESVVLYISVHVMGYVVADGKSNWLEGIILTCLYVIIAIAFWFYPGSDISRRLAGCN